MKKNILFILLFFTGIGLVQAQNVGIGTLTPTEKIHVQGNARITALGGAGNALVLTDNNGVLSRTALSGNGTDVLDGTGTFVPIASLNDDDWRVVGSNMYSVPTNNVGIGTTAPSAKLDVVGVLELSNVVPTDPGSDIVRLGDGGSNLHIQTNHGYTRVGPQNGAWSHFITDRPRFYFDKGITVDQGLIGSYDENLSLQTSGTTRMTILNSNGYVGIGTTNPSYPLHVTRAFNGNWQGRFTNGGSNVYLAHQTGYGIHVNTGGTNSSGRYALQVRNASQTHMYVREDGNVGIKTTAPSQALDINGSIRIRGGGPAVGAVLMANNANGTAAWSRAGYGAVPIGSIVAWHKNAAGGIPALPAGWVECNGGTSSGITVPNLNGNTTSRSGDASYGRFLRGRTTSGTYETDQSNNLYWINHDDNGSSTTSAYLNDDGTTVTVRNYSTDGDRFQARLEGVETRVTNMAVVWIMRTS